MLAPKIIPIIGCRPKESVIDSSPNANIVDALPNNTQKPNESPLIFVGNNSAQYVNIKAKLIHNTNLIREEISVSNQP